MDSATDGEHGDTSDPGPPAGPGDTVGRLQERLAEVRTAGAFQSPLAGAQNSARLRRRLVDRAIATPIDQLVEQLRGYASLLGDALAAIADVLEHLQRTGLADGAELKGCLAAVERVLTAVESPPARLEAREAPWPFETWYTRERFEDVFRGSRESLTARYTDLVRRFAGIEPVVDLGCGRGEVVRLLRAHGIDVRGVDLDGRVIGPAVREGLPLEQGDALDYLRKVPDGSLGGAVAIQLVEHLSPRQVVELVSLAAVKLRAGGLMFTETPNPQSLVVFTSALYIDPTHTTPIHPTYLAFLFREAGFAEVHVEFRSPVPDDVPLPIVSGTDHALVEGVNAVIERLNAMLYGPQDFAVVASR